MERGRIGLFREHPGVLDSLFRVVHELWRPLTSSTSVKSGQVWYQGREGTTGLLKTFMGTQLKTRQRSGNLAKVSQGAKIVDFIYFKQGALHGGLSHGRERGLSFKRIVTAVQGEVDHCAPTTG